MKILEMPKFLKIIQRSFFLCSLSLLAAPSIFAVKTTPPKEKCSLDSTQATTSVAPVDFPKVLADLKALESKDGVLFVQGIPEDFQKELLHLFANPNRKTSKLEQFYGLLYLIAEFKTEPKNDLEFTKESVQRLLISSKVFSDASFPSHIESVHLAWKPKKKKASYQVKFDRERLAYPLNKGNGFKNWNEGMCQTAQSLIFYGGFSFDVERNKQKNFYVSNFSNVDLYGEFGARGTVDVDIQYVSIKSVEFLNNSVLGVVRAKISPKEFEVNDHSWMLKMVNKLVTDKSTQAIDW